MTGWLKMWLSLVRPSKAVSTRIGNGGDDGIPESVDKLADVANIQTYHASHLSFPAIGCNNLGLLLQDHFSTRDRNIEE